MITSSACLIFLQGSYRVESLKKTSNLPSNFPDLEKVWKIEIKSGKMIKSLEFFPQSYTSALQVKFFCFGQISPVRFQCIVKKTFVLYFLRSELFDKCESGKINSCFGKSLEKVLNFGSKNLYEPCFCGMNLSFPDKPSAGLSQFRV